MPTVEHCNIEKYRNLLYCGGCNFVMLVSKFSTDKNKVLYPSYCSRSMQMYCYFQATLVPVNHT